MVFQSFNLYNHLSVLDNLTLGPVKLLRKSKAEAELKAMELLKLVGLAERLPAFPRALGRAEAEGG